MVSRATEVPSLSLFVDQSRERQVYGGRKGMLECPNGVPCGTYGADPDLAQRPLEQMSSISYFVTAPCPTVLRHAAPFSRAPTRTCDLFRRHISRLNVPPPLRAQNAHAFTCAHACMHSRTVHARSSFPFRLSFLPLAILVTLRIHGHVRQRSVPSLLPISARFET